MDKDELTAWALANGWQMLGGHPSLTNAVRPKEAIVRLVLKATVAHVEIKRPAGKWEKVAGTSYDQIRPDDNTGIPRGLGLVSTPGFTKLMLETKGPPVAEQVGLEQCHVRNCRNADDGTLITTSILQSGIDESAPHLYALTP